MDLELWHLAVTVGANAASREAFLATGPGNWPPCYAAGSLPAVAQTGLRGFLDRYGHRAVAEIDLGMPRWSEKPDHILGMISNYLRVEDPEQAPDRQFARAEEHAEARIRSLVERTRTRSRLRARLVEFCLRRTRQLSRAARTAEVLYRPRPRGNAPAARPRSAPNWPGPVRSPPRTMSTSWTSTRSAWVCAVPT